MLLVLPVWPRITRFPAVTFSLILLNAAVFLLSWPAEKASVAVAGSGEKTKAARELAGVLSSEAVSLSAADRALLDPSGSSPFPSPALEDLFARVQSDLAGLTSFGRHRWDSVYPLFQSYSRAVAADPRASTPFRTWGFRPGADVWPGILTHQFLHAGFLHLLGNMLFLWAVGGVVESFLGRGLAGLYVAGGAAAAWAQVWWGMPEGALMVGASGAVSSILGFGFSRLPTAETKIFYVFAPFLTARWGTFDSPLWFFLPLWAGEQVLMALLTRGSEVVSVGYGAHLGGFAVGLFLGLLHRVASPGREEKA